MSSAHGHDYAGVGLAFATALARRDYTAAYALTSSEYQRGTTIAEMQAAFETIVPTDWRTVGPVEVGVTMDTWPDKQSSDVGWAYVSIGGEVYSEAVIVVVALESDSLRIRTVEFGRP
jgi:hypothetical protein